MKTGLVIIFNHKYDNNIPILREIYARRFSKVLFLVPFFKGIENDVVAVYESSYCFQAYINQAYKNIMEMDCDYYLFIGDDLIINPAIDENNIVDICRLVEKDVFMIHPYEVYSESKSKWPHVYNGIQATLDNKYVNWKDELPSREEAFDLLNEYVDKKLSSYIPESVIESNDYLTMNQRCIIGELKKCNSLNNKVDNYINYPLLGAYSDIFILSRKVLPYVSRYFGITASMNLFVEIAIPTSISLSVKREQVVFDSEISMDSKAMWSEKDIHELENINDYSLANLFNNWNSNVLFYHPIKLSIWSMNPKHIENSNNYITEEYVKNKLDTDDEYVIFGIGEYGMNFVDTLISNRINPICIVDNNKNLWNSTYKDITIYSLNDVIQKHKDKKWVVCSKDFRNDIKKQLVNMGIAPNSIMYWLK